MHELGDYGQIWSAWDSNCAHAGALLVPIAEQSRASEARYGAARLGRIPPLTLIKQAKRKELAGRAHLSGRDGAEDLHSGGHPRGEIPILPPR